MNSKYLKYAIGEIFLVVIGILIAVSINTWNQSLKDRREESVYLENIKRDLAEQISGIERNINGEKAIVEQLIKAETFYDTLKGFQINQEAMISLASLNNRYTFNVVNPTYKELLSSGKIDLISDKELKSKLIRYYEDLELKDVIIQKNNDSKDFAMLPQLYNLFEMAGANAENLRFENASIEDSFEGYQTPKRILNLVKQSLAKPENELSLINMIRFNQLVATFNLGICETIKSNAQELLIELN